MDKRNAVQSLMDKATLRFMILIILDYPFSKTSRSLTLP